MKSSGRIDGLVALAMALGAASHEDTSVPPSPWGDPDFRMEV